MSDLCRNCGRKTISHVNGRCPLGLHVVIDASTIERVAKTGHPRVLGILLDKKTPSWVFSDVRIESWRVVSKEGVEE